MTLLRLFLFAVGAARLASAQQQACDMTTLSAHATAIDSVCCPNGAGCSATGVPTACSNACAAPFLVFVQECQGVIAAMPTAADLHALADQCRAVSGIPAGCTTHPGFDDICSKADKTDFDTEVAALHQLSADKDQELSHLAALVQILGERLEGAEARVHLLEMEESELGQNHCAARQNPNDLTTPSTMGGQNGDIDAYCTEECPCGEGEGDCDTSAQCAGGLVCEQEYVLGVGRACPSWMRPDATCCYAQGHGSGRDQCAGLSEGAPCDDSNAATTDDSCHDDQCGGWQSFPTIVADQAQKDAWLTCEGVRHPTLAAAGVDNGGWLHVDLTSCGDCYDAWPKYLSEDNTHGHGDIWMPLTSVSYVACHFPDVTYIDWRPGHSVAGNSAGRSLFVYTYGPNADGSDGNTPVGVIRSESFGCSQTQTTPCSHTVIGYDTIELFVTAEGTCATKLDGAICNDGSGDTTRDECRWGRCGGWLTIDTVLASEAERLDWLHADPNGVIASSSNDGTISEVCTECTLPSRGGKPPRNHYPKYLFLGGQHDSDEVTEQTVESYMAWRYPEVSYLQWQPGHSLGDQRANTLFVLGGRVRSESQTQVIGHDDLQVFVYGDDGH